MLNDEYDIDWAEVIDILAKEYGWKDYGNKHCENKYTQWFQEYYQPKKFGYDKRKAHLSSLIHSGQITRDEALKELAIPLSEHQDISREIMQRFELPPKVFETMMKLPPMTYKDYYNGQWMWQFTFKIIRALRKIKINL